MVCSRAHSIQRRTDVVMARGTHMGLKGNTAARDINLGELTDIALSAMDEKSSRGSRREP